MTDLTPMTVGTLRELLKDLPDDWPVQINNDQDYRVDEWQADEKDGLVLFANDEPSSLLECPTCGWQAAKGWQSAATVVKTLYTHCGCCGALKMNCVCGGGQTFSPTTGTFRRWSCKPQDHGRDGYGFDNEPERPK